MGMKENKILRVGIIGAGWIADNQPLIQLCWKWMHAQFLRTGRTG